ncbi:hypothetical protein EMIT0357P_60212 [Pseudomonas marginalis]
MPEKKHYKTFDDPKKHGHDGLAPANQGPWQGPSDRRSKLPTRADSCLYRPQGVFDEVATGTKLSRGTEANQVTRLHTDGSYKGPRCPKTVRSSPLPAQLPP